VNRTKECLRKVGVDIGVWLNTVELSADAGKHLVGCFLRIGDNHEMREHGIF
jgi:hypothetical protein